MSERELENCLQDYWFLDTPASPSASDAPSDDDPRDALARLERPDIVVRGRNLVDVLQLAYDALKQS